jgi:hypothetical protein
LATPIRATWDKPVLVMAVLGAVAVSERHSGHRVQICMILGEEGPARAAVRVDVPGFVVG